MTDYEKLIAREGDSAAKGVVVAPLIRLYLSEGNFPPGRLVKMPEQGTRPPDGWFHPSTHPTMDERKLYHYLADPDRWVPEPWSWEGRMSVTVGTLMHGVVETLLEDLGVWQMPTGTCPCCLRPHGRGPGLCAEPGVADEVLGRRGHMDGVLLLRMLGMVGFDLKTINHFSVLKMPDMDVEFIKIKYPYYYAQMQEYMALSGLRIMIMVFMGMGYPWHIREVHIPYDEGFVLALEGKYRRVREAVAAGEPPMPCCEPRTTKTIACPAHACRIKNI